MGTNPSWVGEQQMSCSSGEGRFDTPAVDKNQSTGRHGGRETKANETSSRRKHTKREAGFFRDRCCTKTSTSITDTVLPRLCPNVLPCCIFLARRMIRCECSKPAKEKVEQDVLRCWPTQLEDVAFQASAMVLMLVHFIRTFEESELVRRNEVRLHKSAVVRIATSNVDSEKRPIVAEIGLTKTHIAGTLGRRAA